MANAERVLVVDGISETAEVLRAVLEPRGLHVERIRGPRPQEPGEKSPSVVVLHEESTPGAASWPGVPRVIIGSYQQAASGVQETHLRRLSGPFQYPELISAIEELLAADRAETNY